MEDEVCIGQTIIQGFQNLLKIYNPSDRMNSNISFSPLFKYKSHLSKFLLNCNCKFCK